MPRYYWGEDTYAAWEALVLEAQAAGAVLRWLDQDSLNKGGWGDLVDAGKSLWGRELVVLKDPLRLAADDQERLADAVKQGRTGQAVFWERGKPDSRLKLHKELTKLGVQECRLLPAAEMRKWLIDLAHLEGVKLNADAAAWMMTVYQGDRWRLANEVKRLAVLGKEISLELVQQDGEARLEAEIFRVLDAVVERQAKAAVQGVQALLDQGEPELKIMATLNSQLKSLWMISKGAAGGMPPAQVVAATRLHPYVVEKSWQRARKVSPQVWWNSMRRVAASNLSIKQGRIQERTALLMLVASLAEPVT